MLVVGVVLIAIGLVLATYCGANLLGICIYYPYQGVGGGLAGLGVILLILGIVLMVLSAPTPATAPPVFSPQPVYGQSPQYVAPPVQPSPPRAIADRFCPSCGTGAARSATFCNTCGKPLPPPPS